MTSQAVRDPLADHLITPQNSAFLLIDWQPTQISTVRSMDPDLLLRNAVSTVRTVKAYGVPVVHSTVNVASGQQQPTVPELAELVQDDEPLDRTTMNSWEDVEFVDAVRATGRRKLILCALWTEICMAFVALDALREGYEVYPVVDAIGGTSLEAHRAGLERTVQAGAQPISWVSPCRRAAARLGSSGNSSGARRDRPDGPPVEGVSRRRGPGMTLTVDLHHHVIPDFYWEASNEDGNAAGGINPPRWSLDGAIAYLDEAGIDVAVPSISTPGVHFGDDAAARNACASGQ